MNEHANKPLVLQCTIWYTTNHARMHVVNQQICEWIGRMGMMFATSYPIFRVKILGDFGYLHPVSDSLFVNG